MTAKLNAPSRFRHASGFTMLEVLISIVVIAFGLLGIAGLQAFALKNNQSASLRSTATVLAADIIDRIRANPLGGDQNFYNAPSAGDYTTEVASCMGTGGCSPESLAQNDLYQWSTNVAAALPNGAGIVCLDSTPMEPAATAAAPLCDGAGNQYVVKIWWVDDRTRSAIPGQFATQFER